MANTNLPPAPDTRMGVVGGGTDKTRLIMLSGGIDSAYILWDALNNSKDDVFAHHISIRNLENRWQQEREAVTKIIKYFDEKKIRPFMFSESVWSFPYVEYFCWDIHVVAFVASQVAHNLKGKVTVYTGDYEGFRAEGEDDDKGRELRSKIADDILASACQDRENIEKKLVKPLIGIEKAEIVKKLPDDLLSLTWSCRTPKDGKPCEVCKTCKDLAEIKKK